MRDSLTLTLSQLEREFFESKIKNNSENWLGYGKGDRTRYPTLFGWEKRKRPCLFHQLPGAVNPKEGAEPFKQFKPFKWSKSLPGCETPGNGFFQYPGDNRRMANEMPNLQVCRSLRRHL